MATKSSKGGVPEGPRIPASLPAMQRALVCEIDNLRATLGCVSVCVRVCGRMPSCKEKCEGKLQVSLPPRQLTLASLFLHIFHCHVPGSCRLLSAQPFSQHTFPFWFFHFYFRLFF